MMIAGLVMVVAYLGLFGPRSRIIHLTVTGLTVFTVALTFSMIIAFDYPYRGGDLSVDDDAYVSVKDVSETIFPLDDEPEAPAAK
jgi:hypothetical protein